MALPVIDTPPVIPVIDTPNDEVVKVLDESVSAMKSLESILTRREKANLIVLEKLRDNTAEFVEREKAIGVMLEKKIFTPEQAKEARLRNKLTIAETKREKEKFWPKLLRGVQTMSKGIAKMAGDWFTKIIGFLLAMAIFDPKGKLLGSILKFFGGILVWFIKALANKLPAIISTMINLIVDVLPGLLKNLVAAIFPAIGQALQKLSKNLMKDFPILGWIVGKLGQAFGKDGILYKFTMLLVKLFPVLLSGFLAIGAFVKLWPFLSAIFGALKTIGLFFLANPIVAIILGVAAALMYWAKESGLIAAIFSKEKGSMSKWFKEKFLELNKIQEGLSVIGNFFITVFDGVIGFVKYLEKKIKSFPKKIKKFVSDLASYIPRKIKSIIDRTINFFTAPFKPLMDTLMGIGNKLAPIFKPIFKVLEKIWDLIQNTILRTINWIKEAFHGIMDMFAAASHYGFVKYFIRAGETEKGAMLQSARLARVRGTTLEDVAKGSTVIARRTRAQLEAYGYRTEEGKLVASGVSERNVRRTETTVTRLNKIQKQKIDKRFKSGG